MIRGMLLAAMLAWASGACANDFWNSLWYNADQRGEQLMHQGNAAAAAHTYTDPQHKAYAELQAGDYQQAAQDFSAFNDSTSSYNRGNALAHAGQLQNAIKAYDAALARDPKNKDARHNRDLVMQALKKQPPPPKPAPNKNTSSDKDKKTSQSQSGSNKNADKQNGSQQPPSADSKSGNGDQHNNTEQNKGNGKNAQTGVQPQQPQGQQQSASTKPSHLVGQPQAQARNDTASEQGNPMTGQQPLSVNAPVSEKKLAQEQWLRSIPDDPGGLLRRKFMIEHMIRQQER